MNGFQAGRAEVLRRLSAPSDQVYSVYWNIERDNAFTYAAAGEVVVEFDGGYPVRRSGSGPDVLEAQREPLWAAGGSWRAAMLALAEIRTGVRLDDSWFERAHPAVRIPEVPDDPPVPSLEGDIVMLLERRDNPRRHAALAWLAETLARRFELGSPALARAIDARRAGVRVDEETKRQVQGVTGELVRRMLARDEVVPQERDPVWRRGQAAMAADGVLGFADASILVLHARNALADDWPAIAVRLRAHL